MEGFRERKEPGIAPLQALVPLFPSQSLGVGEGQARCPQPLSLASNLADPVLGPSCCLWDWGGGSPRSWARGGVGGGGVGGGRGGGGGAIRQETMA